MSGTVAGGLKTANINKDRHGEDFYKRIGAKGGKFAGLKGFALMDPEKHRLASAKGGRISRRTKKQSYNEGAICVDQSSQSQGPQSSTSSISTLKRQTFKCGICSETKPLSESATPRWWPGRKVCKPCWRPF